MKERERNVNVWLPLTGPLLGTWPATKAYALTGNRTSNPLVLRPVLNPLSHTSQGQSYLLKCKGNGEEDGGQIGGSRVHFPLAPVKCLADLRNRANSQWYSSMYEDQKPKTEDIERSDSMKSA